MNRKTNIATLGLSLCLYASGVAAADTNTNWDSYAQAGQVALDREQYKKAEGIWMKAVKELEATGTQDKRLADSLTKLAQAYRKGGKFVDANTSLQRAFDIYQTMGVASPEFSQQYVELSRVYHPIDFDQLGQASANALKGNSAKMGASFSDAGKKVEISVPERFEKPLNSQKLDQIALEKLVTFTFTKDGNGALHFANIKGFKIHSVEKGMWVNLLDLILNGEDGQGQYDATIKAGKSGITKTVAAKLPAKVYEPLAGIARESEKLGSPAEAPVITIKTSPTPVHTHPSLETVRQEPIVQQQDKQVAKPQMSVTNASTEDKDTSLTHPTPTPSQPEANTATQSIETKRTGTAPASMMPATEYGVGTLRTGENTIRSSNVESNKGQAEEKIPSSHKHHDDDDDDDDDEKNGYEKD